MGKTSVFSIILIVLTILGWGAFILSPKNAEKNELNKHIAQAEEYYDRGLYQKSIEEYDQALKLENTETIWNGKIKSYQSWYEENSKAAYDSYLNAIRIAHSLYSKNIDYLLTLANLYVDHEDYRSAYKYLRRSVDNGVSNDQVLDLMFTTKYKFEMSSTTYLDCKSFVNERYEVFMRNQWMYIDNDGTADDTEDLTFAGPIGDDGVRVVSNSVRSYLVNGNGVIQGILDFSPEDAGVYSEGLVPIKNNGSYGYYTLLGDYAFGDYEYAGTFVDGLAAVQDKESGMWTLIDTEGNPAGGSYDDIVLYADGKYINRGLMIVKEGDKYNIYVDEECIGSFDNVDIPTSDGIIAVSEKGWWGYINRDGEMIIEPQYARAKSFSNGLAAVFNGEYWGFIDTDNKLAIDYQFYDADYFNNKMNCLVLFSVDDVEEDDGQTRTIYNWKLLKLFNK